MAGFARRKSGCGPVPRWAGLKRHAEPLCIGFVCARTAWSIDTELSRRRSLTGTGSGLRPKDLRSRTFQ